MCRCSGWRRSRSRGRKARAKREIATLGLRRGSLAAGDAIECRGQAVRARAVVRLSAYNASRNLPDVSRSLGQAFDLDFQVHRRARLNAPLRYEADATFADIPGQERLDGCLGLPAHTFQPNRQTQCGSRSGSALRSTRAFPAEEKTVESPGAGKTPIGPQQKQAQQEDLKNSLASGPPHCGARAAGANTRPPPGKMGHRCDSHIRSSPVAGWARSTRNEE